MARYNRLQGAGPDRTQNSTQDGLDALERGALGPASRNGAPQSSNGRQTARVALVANEPKLVAHKLGRPYRGWNVALKDAPQSIFCPPDAPPYDKSKYICVQSGGDVGAEFWVY